MPKPMEFLNQVPDVYYGDALRYAEELAGERTAPLADRIAELEAQVPRWIPCDRLLPQDFTDVMGAWDDSDDAPQVFRLQHEDAYLDESGWETDGHIKAPPTHWMPLPTPPTTNQEQGHV